MVAQQACEETKMAAKGILTQGGNGTAVPAGMVGEVIETSTDVYQNTTSGAYYTVQMNLTPGVWEVSATALFNRNGATISSAFLIGNITNQDANPSAPYGFYKEQSATFGTDVTAIAPIRISWNGTTNVCTGSANSSNGYAMLRLYPGVFTGGPVQVKYSMRAVRIA
jgi:hypothetical protein